MRSALVLGVLALHACDSFGDAPATGGGDAGLEDAATTDVDTRDAAPPDAAVADTTLLAHWKMDESGGTAASESVGGRDGLITGTGGFVAGKIGNAFSTEGGVAHVVVGNTEGLAVSERFTVAMWISLAASPDDSFFYAHGYQFAMKLNVRRPQLYVGDLFVNVPYNVPAEEWHHVAATFDSGKVKIYVDGTDAGEDERGGMATTAPPMKGPIRIGTSDGQTSSARGAIDDVRVWSRALTAPEIKDIAAGK